MLLVDWGQEKTGANRKRKGKDWGRERKQTFRGTED